MILTVVHGTANQELAGAVARELGTPPGECRINRFPDGELQVEVMDNPRGRDVFLIHGTHPPVGENLLELLFMADAYRRAGAERVSAVIPYFGYARQDRRKLGRESLGARLVAELLNGSSLQRVIAVDLHTAAIEGCFDDPLEHLTAVPLLAERARAHLGGDAVVVSPDLGAVKLAERYAERLGLPMAVVHKIRRSGADVKAQGVVGDVAGKAPVIIDDMITTGGTIEAAARAVLELGARPELTVVATHGLLVGPAVERLSRLPLKKLLITDSIPAGGDTAALPIERVSLAPLIAETLRRLNAGQPLVDLLANR